MLCVCGSSSFIKLEEKTLDFRISYKSCDGCGRIGGEKLYLNRKLMLRNLPARKAFNSSHRVRKNDSKPNKT